MSDIENIVLNGIIGFVTTLAGVLIAFGLTFWDDRKKKKADERETQSRIATAIHLELEANLKTIDESRETFAKERMQRLLIIFPSGAYDSAVSSGFLSLFDSALQYDLTSTYTGFKRVESMSARVLPKVGGVDMNESTFSNNVKTFQVIIDLQMEALQKAIPGLLKHLESEAPSDTNA